METNKLIIDTTMPDSAQNPDLTAIQAAPAGETTTNPATSADPAPNETPFTLGTSKGETVDPLNLPLPFFLRWQIQDETRAKNLLAAIDKLFFAFDLTEESKNLFDVDLNQSLAYSALRFSLMDMIEKAATIRLGSFTRPKPSDYLWNPVNLATGDPELDNAPVLVENPIDYTDVEKLQEWVTTLQQMVRLQQKMHAGHEKIDALQQKTIQQQEDQINNLERLAELNKQATTAAAQREYEKTVPKALNYIDLTLYLADGYDSDTELVREALADLAKEKLERVLQKIVNDETDEAFNFKQEYNRIQTIVSRLATTVSQQASDSYARHRYQAYPEGYMSQEASERTTQDKRRAEFIRAYSVYSHDEEEESSESEPRGDEKNAAESDKPQASTEPATEG